MPITTVNHFRCDNSRCTRGADGKPEEFYYNPNPNPPNAPWPDGVKVRLTKIIATAHPLTNHNKIFCCDECMLEGIKDAIHIPPAPADKVPDLTKSATDADVARAAAAAKQTEGMKVQSIR